ncbi:SHOCT domain-containing protein [Pseudonocardiaceae bacterium YIM PH 21723]|nr:SHOCT domain-containing protein [Pseudonocardiaceae bacterium YIM PH 21723]
MSWQEEIRELDDALAAGRLTPKEYEQKADEILSVASAAAKKKPDDPDKTQIVRHPGAKPELRTSPPAESPFPPVDELSNWTNPDKRTLDGAEVFGGGNSRQPSGRGGIIIGFVVLVLIAAGVWWFVLNATSGDDSASDKTAKPATGQVVEGLTAQPYSDAEVQAFKQAGATGIGYNVSLLAQAGNVDSSLVTVNTKDAPAAKELTAKLVDIYKAQKLVVVEKSGLPAGVTVLREVSANGVVHRAVYSSGGQVVRIGAVEKADTPVDAALAHFVTIVSETVKKAPVT